MRVLMTGGGTAGHVNPAIAIANTIKKYQPDAEIAFVCSHRPTDKAHDLVPRAGYKDPYKVRICGLGKIYSPSNIRTLWYMLTSPKEARRIIDEFRPDVIIGTGGYACYPVAKAGLKMGIPVALHESNALAGKAIRSLAHKADLVMTNFESTARALGDKAICVGNPTIDSAAVNVTASESEYKRHVLIFGGSLGAETINTAVVKILSAISDRYPDVEFVHASGKRDHARMQEQYAEAGLDKKDNVVLLDYIYDMARRMDAAELAVCRAGAMTISELALGAKAAILVPSPYVAANHQYINAKALADEGAAVLVEESEIDRLSDEIVRLLDDSAARARMQERITAFAKPDANDIIYNEILKLVR